MNMTWDAPKKGQRGFCLVCHRDRVLAGKFRTRKKSPDMGPRGTVLIEEAALDCGHHKPLRVINQTK